MYTILGAGLSGLAVADFLNKKGIPFRVFEAKSHGGGHVYSEKKDGFTWDEGPHVSFTKSEFVREYFSDNCEGRFLEYSTTPVNYFRGNWIPHPAQTNLFAIPVQLRQQIIDELKIERENKNPNLAPENYQKWIEYAFGKTFSKYFPEVYTKKYWTTDPGNLSTDWIGKRIYFPELSDVIESAKGPLEKQTHYISKVRYPESGGYYSFISKVEEDLTVNYNKRLQQISFEKKQIIFEDGSSIEFKNLISTIPLPEIILKSDAPLEIKNEASKLKCSQLLIINVVVDHPPPVRNQWIYVYDKEMYSTRINFTDLLSANNGVKEKTGIQVEVYFSDYNPLTESHENIAEKVLEELVEMKLIENAGAIESYHTKWIEYANIIFDLERRGAQDKVLNWLATKGLVREEDDLDPMTDWENKLMFKHSLGELILAGRFAQWKYYWTDDCVLRAKYISDLLSVGIEN